MPTTLMRLQAEEEVVEGRGLPCACDPTAALGGSTALALSVLKGLPATASA